MISMRTLGIHHITAFAGDPQANVDFYAGVLGLRLVKKTINFDAPEVYHLYFGDEQGSPGTIMTFFPYAGTRRGTIGGGQVGVTSFAIPVGSLAFWKARLERFNVPFNDSTRFQEPSILIQDPDGLRIELVEREAKSSSVWTAGTITAEVAIHGFGGATLYSVRAANTRSVLERTLGLTFEAEEQGIARFRAHGDRGQVIDLSTSDLKWGAGGAGTIHHIAWRAVDYAEHEQWRIHVANQGYQPTQIIDRQYFNAIYFRESGGILFEIATDPPGFARDERPEELGSKLMLPVWYEPHRHEIERNLAPIEVRVLEGTGY